MGAYRTKHGRLGSLRELITENIDEKLTDRSDPLRSLQEKRTRMSKTPAGGAATVGGVVYQLLWSLLELTRFEVRDVQQDDDGVLTSAVLLLEPEGGGGDARVETEDRYVVVQLKTRSGGGTWSLQEVISKVFPDLLKGVRLDAAKPEYQFVTDGRIGKWKGVRRLFRSLRGLSEQEIASVLESPGTFTIGAQLGSTPEGKAPFWTKPDYTARELVDKIVDTVSSDNKTVERSDLEQRVVHLLAHFEFCEPQTVADAEARIDAALSEKVDYVEDVPGTRQRLLQRLAELARAGNAPIELGTFLTDAGLDALPASHIGKIVARGRDVLAQRLSSLRFRLDHHVQERFTQHLVSHVVEFPIVLVTGESGSGKSWHCCAVADLLARQGAVVAHVEAKPNADDTLDRAMGVLWNTIKGNDSMLSYDRAARGMHGPPPPRVLIIDRVEDPILARDLAVADCDTVNLRLVLGCTREAAEAAKAAHPKRCSLVEARPFTPTELNDYLAARLVPRWDTIPADVRRALQAPLMASLYCESVEGKFWRPSNEYDLYDHYWQSRLGLGSGADPSLDTALLRDLARAFLEAEPYPFSADRMHALVKHEGSFVRLRKSGILSVRSDGSCEIWHDRLLNWLVALTLAEDTIAGSRTPMDTASVCAAAAAGELRPSGKRLGYVPMDTLWHLATRGANEEAASVLSTLEASRGQSNLYTELVPTLGSHAAPALLHRLDQLLTAKPSYVTTEIANCLAQLKSPEVIKKSRELLAGKSTEGHSVAFSILRKQGDPESLGRIWDVHLSATEDEARGVDYVGRMDALAASMRLRPQWLIERLEQAQQTTPGLTDLVYQLARLDEGATHWARLKQRLKTVVPESRRRSLIRCIYVFRDRDEIEFLRTEADREEDFAGDMALAALTRLDPETAAAELANSSLRQVVFTRGWHFRPLLAARPEVAQNAVRELVQRRAERWVLCEMYRGAENQIDVASFELVMDHLVTTLRAESASGSPDANSGPLHGPLGFVDRIVAPELVACLRARNGGELPQLLGAYLLAIGPRDSMNARLTDRPALRILQRIGDPALVQWVKQGLRASTRYGRLDALQEAHKHTDDDVLALLQTIALGSDEGKDGFESYLAIHALTQLEAWEVVVDATIASGLSISPYPFESRRGAPPLNGEFVESLYSKMTAEAATPGILMAAGLTRDPRFIELLVSTIARGSVPPEILLGVTIAAELLDVRDDEAVQHIARRLGDENVPDRLPGLVLQLGTPTALTAVEGYLERHFDPALCAALAQHDGWKDRAATLAWERRAEAERSPGFGLILTLLTGVGDDEARRYLEDLAFGFGHERLGRAVRLEAVRALSTIDQDRAYDAALGAARDLSEKDRARFPRLLVELAANRAVPHLLELIRARDTEDFELAAADAVSGCDISEQIDAMLQSEDTSARRTGCILAGRRPIRESTTKLLRERAVDIDEAVARAAMAALWEDTRAHGIRVLAEEAANESGERRWIAIDHAIAAARGTKDAPEARQNALSPLDRKLSPLEEHAADESFRKGESDYRHGVQDRARRHRG